MSKSTQTTGMNLGVFCVIHDEVDIVLTVDPDNDYEVRDAVLERIYSISRLVEVFSFFSKIPFVQPTFDIEFDNTKYQFGSFQPTNSLDVFKHRLDRLKKEIEDTKYNPFMTDNLWELQN